MNGKTVVGIVGRVGSGKSAVAGILKEKFGFVHVDVDAYGHTALEKEKKQLTEAFGSGILDGSGNIDRPKLGELVFSSPDKLLLLNSIVHPRMKTEIASFITASGKDRFAVDGALLFEIGLDEICDFIITVEAPEKDILHRVKEYRDWSEDKARKVLKSQEYLKFLKEKTSYLVINNGDMDKLLRQIEFFIHIIF